MTATPETFIKALDCALKFLRQHEFDFTLTGTTALMTQGLLPENYEPHDIDVLVYNTTSEQYKLLRQMENLAGAYQRVLCRQHYDLYDTGEWRKAQFTMQSCSKRRPQSKLPVRRGQLGWTYRKSPNCC